MTQPHLCKLGKKRPRHDRRTLRLADYLTGTLPVPPPGYHWGDKFTNWGVMLNDNIGDCTCAAVGHAVQLWTANNGNVVTVPDSAILQMYEKVSGYNPAQPQTDQGAVILDVLNYWRKNPVSGHPLGAYAALEPGNIDHVKDSIYLFGLNYIGLQLPQSAQVQIEQGRVWSVPTYGPKPHAGAPDGSPGSWGGHAVVVVDYDRFGLLCVTWGMLQRMTWQFWHYYCDESYALLSNDWVTSAKPAPSGFNLAALQADLPALAA
jgi:hypothetical protein